MKRILVLVATILIVGLNPATHFAQSGYDLFQQALVKEQATGDLPAAIELLKRIVQDHADNRALAAKALLEMGECYEKLGREEARKAYERLLRDYGDQNEAAAAARKRLAALGQTAGPRNGSAMVVRRVWAGPDVDVLGGLSPDGRYLSCVDWTTGALALRDLATGKMRRLTNDGFSTELIGSIISPDGKEVVYNWYNKDGSPDLRIMRLDGSAPRILYSAKGVLFLGAGDWSPDGKYILTSIYRKPSSWQIALISVADGSIRVLKTLDWFPTRGKFSPDGRYIAYDLAQEQDSGNRDIFLLAADGSREIRLVQHPADDQLLGWTPDGNSILFASDRSGSMSAWAIRVADGKPQGSPELVKPNIGQVLPIGFTRSGSFYYGLVVGTIDIYTADFDPAAGKVLTPPQNATQRFVGSNSSPAWSPDGQSLAYISHNRHWLAVQRPEVISIRSLKTGAERDLPPKLTFLWGPLRWSPDGRSILASGKDWKVRHGTFQIDAQTGEVTPIVWWGDAEISNPAWFPDGKRLLYSYSLGESSTTTETILVRDLQTGREASLFRSAPSSRIDDIALSPDGQQVALTLLEKKARSSVLKVLPVAGGEASELVRAKEPETIVGDSLTWSPDSRYIVFGRGRASSNVPKTELFAISPHGGKPHRLGLAMDFVRDVSFHPDGRHIAFAASAGRDKVEVWVMENFLPTLKAAK
ncbi:MAG TPA: tetratricopeptide repeat protein [Terriglobia bacterium]|nr:tetratricopeptide repeat protein [Terriglobia bacterium]